MKTVISGRFVSPYIPSEYFSYLVLAAKGWKLSYVTLRVKEFSVLGLGIFMGVVEMEKIKMLLFLFFVMAN